MGDKRYIEQYGIKVRLRCKAERSVITPDYIVQCMKLSGHKGKHGNNLDGAVRRKWMLTW